MVPSEVKTPERVNEHALSLFAQASCPTACIKVTTSCSFSAFEPIHTYCFDLGAENKRGRLCPFIFRRFVSVKTSFLVPEYPYKVAIS